MNYAYVHWGMFAHAIKGSATEDQRQQWLPLANKMQIIGTYAQTELGHGSNIQGLETTVTFDPETDEFTIHRPTLTSSTWWPGGLGKVATHAVVYALLITNDQDYGVHIFLVQIRSLDDHFPLPGVTIGDIGMKFGSGAFDSKESNADEVLKGHKTRKVHRIQRSEAAALWSYGLCQTNHCS